MEESVGTGVIYKYTSPSGKCYIGQTRNEPRRKDDHRKTNNHCPAFHDAIRKYGFYNFRYEILHNGIQSQEVLNCLEVWEIENNNSISPNGYNLTYGGLHGILSEESVAKIVQKNTGRPKSEETRKKISESKKGKKRSPESVEKSAEGHRGKPKSEEFKQYMSELFKDRIISDETRLKMSVSQTGKKRSQESIEKGRAKTIGQKRSPETCRKISEANKGKTRKKKQSPGI